MNNDSGVGIYYFTDPKIYDTKLRGYFQNRNLELYYEQDLGRVLSKILVCHPSVLIFDGFPDEVDQKLADIFDINSVFYVPFVCFLCSSNEFKLKKPLPLNCVMCKKDCWKSFFDEKFNSNKLITKTSNNVIYFPVGRFDLIVNTLSEFGININSSGSIFLKDCINQVLIDDCKAYTLYNRVYNVVAKIHNTTINNLERCMRSTISSAWENYLKNKARYSAYGKYIYAEKPTVKEFIYYLSNLIKNIEYENKIVAIAKDMV